MSRLESTLEFRFGISVPNRFWQILICTDLDLDRTDQEQIMEPKWNRNGQADSSRLDSLPK